MEKNVNSTGSVKISNDVIVKIAGLAATEIDGVAVDNGQLAVQLLPVSGMASRFISPIKVALSKEAAAIDMEIIVEQGHKAISVASAVQEKVKSAVQNMTNIPVSKVNVKIVGIRISKEETKA